MAMVSTPADLINKLEVQLSLYSVSKTLWLIFK